MTTIPRIAVDVQPAPDDELAFLDTPLSDEDIEHLAQALAQHAHIRRRLQGLYRLHRYHGLRRRQHRREGVLPQA